MITAKVDGSLAQIKEAEQLAAIREAAKRREEMAAVAQEPDFLGEVVLAGEGSQMLPQTKTEYTLQRKPGRDRVRLQAICQHRPSC